MSPLGKSVNQAGDVCCMHTTTKPVPRELGDAELEMLLLSRDLQSN